ncbi:hypothetical protein [Coprococcus comes]|uniref:hypothetical protein n=1 Tax=Coprococcus comes TaxID=410072 RepID=UPI001897EA64|nr:hypothetical protein [Coprococcus comes]
MKAYMCKQRGMHLGSKISREEITKKVNQSKYEKYCYITNRLRREQFPLGFLNIPRKLRITYVQFFVLGIYFEKLSGYTDNIKRENCQNEVSRWIQHRE